MSCINDCTFTGRITHTVELKTTTSGKSVCTFSIACERGYGDKKKVVYPTFVAWNGQAEFAAKLQKGTMVAISSEMTERSWETKNGDKRKVSEFVIREIQALESKRAASDEQQPQYAPPSSPDFEEIPGDDDLPF